VAGFVIRFFVLDILKASVIQCTANRDIPVLTFNEFYDKSGAQLFILQRYLRPHKLQQRLIVMSISSTQGINVLFATLSGVYQVAATPAKARLPQQMYQKNIGHQAGMASIAVREWMDCS
jgi:hypothetical protein